MTEKTYFHQIANKYKKDIIMSTTFAEILENYEQPQWCGKHEALNGLFGCPKLLGVTNELTDKESCAECIHFKNE